MTTEEVIRSGDPLKFAKLLWPEVNFYDKQREIICSVKNDHETFVVAGNMLGKDFVAGFIALWFFLTRHPVRVVTTSVKEDHLRVLWGEIFRFIDTSRASLKVEQGGPLIVNQREIRKVLHGQECSISYLRGMVSEKGEGMSGHHAAHTLLIIDEASGVDDVVYNQGDTWAKRKLIVGNPNPCHNFFRKAVKEGTMLREEIRKRLIHIAAEDSPNVQLALAQQREGQQPTNELIVPGVLTWQEYRKRRTTWDPIRQCIGLDGNFYEGAENLLFPQAWLNRAEGLAAGRDLGKALTIGVDPAEGGDKTAICAINAPGVVELVSKKTPDTSRILDLVLAVMRRHDVPASRVIFDRGGGGKQLADLLRRLGHNVTTVGFGDTVGNEMRRGRYLFPFAQKLETSEARYAYKNRRAQMYGELSLLLDPSCNPDGFAIPGEYAELRRQLSPIPKSYDEEGRLMMLPKRRKSQAGELWHNGGGSGDSLVGLLGCSPDESDALALAVYGMLHERKKVKLEVFS